MSTDSRTVGRVYSVSPDEGYEWVVPMSEDDYARIRRLGAEPVASSWQPVPVRRVRHDNNSSLQASDFPWLGGALVMTTRAVSALSTLLASSGELLPLAGDGADLQLFHVTRMIDCLDQEGSMIRRFADGRIMTIDAYSLRMDLVEDNVAFRLPQYPQEPLFVTDSFVSMVDEHGLRGLRFKPIWPAAAMVRASHVRN